MYVYMCTEYRYKPTFCLGFRVGLDGRITLEKRLKGIYVTAEKLHEAQQNLVQAGKEVPIK